MFFCFCFFVFSSNEDTVLNDYLQELENRNGSSTRHFAIHLTYRICFVSLEEACGSIYDFIYSRVCMCVCV